MRLKENTEKSSNQIRGIASLVLALGLALAILLIIFGIGTIMNSGLNGILFILLGGLAFFYHYVAYVMISAYATMIENSDRTDVVEALLDINETLRQGGRSIEK